MIFSFSVPDSPKYKILIEWYNTADRQERSRQFREIFMSYLNKSQHSIETNVNHISLQRLDHIKLDKLSITDTEEVDLDSKLDSLSILGGD